MRAFCTCYAPSAVGLYAHSSASSNLAAMPSKKKSKSQAVKGTASPSDKSSPSVISGTSLVTCDVGARETPQAQRPAGTGPESKRRTFAEAVMTRNPSQKSVSTDAGSSSSGCSIGSPSSEALTPTKPLCSNPGADSRPRSPSDLPARVCAPHSPLWVDNGLKGDKGAWLLVLPKSGLIDALKSPNDAVLLGPYVTTKNTFLDESRVNKPLKQRLRSKSWDACHSCMRSC